VLLRGKQDVDTVSDLLWFNMLPWDQASCWKNVRGVLIFHPIDQLDDTNIIQDDPQGKAKDPVGR